MPGTVKPGAVHPGAENTPRNTKPPVPKHQYQNKEPPPAAAVDASQADVLPGAGGDQSLFDLAIEHGLPKEAAQRFVRIASGVGPDQLEALRHELPLRLLSARNHTATAIGLAKLAKTGELEDTTREQRTSMECARKRREDEAAHQAAEKKRQNEAAAHRAQNGPSPAELACRALSQKFKGAVK